MKLRRTYFDGPHGQIHAQVMGAGPAILLNHQSGSSSGAFAAIYPLLAQAGFTAVGIDTPGMGNSDGPDGDVWTLDLFADAVAAVIDQMGIGRAVVAGHHTGAGTTLRHATLYPRQVAGIALHQILIYDAETRAHFRANPIQPIVPERDGSHLLRAWQGRVGAAGDWQMVAPMNRGVIDYLRSNPQVAKSFAAALAYDAVPDLMALTCPVLNLTNTGDRNHECSQQARALRPDFQYHELAGGALDIMDEQPEAWAGALIAFARTCFARADTA